MNRGVIAVSALLLLSFPSNGADFSDFMRHVGKRAMVRGAGYEEEAARESRLASEGALSPRIDLHLDGAWLKDTPTVTFHMEPPLGSRTVAMGTTRRFEGSVTLTYPIFTGFAISSRIEKGRWREVSARLKKRDMVRKILMSAVVSYGRVVVERARVHAGMEAVSALERVYEKAKGFYKNGLSPVSDLYNIESALYDMKARVEAIRGRMEMAEEDLRVATGLEEKVEGDLKIAPLPERKKVVALAMKRRADISMLEAEMGIRRADVALAKSTLYPRVAMSAAFDRYGDTLSLDGDGYTNSDRSFVGLSIDWNIFDGGKGRHLVESAKYRELATESVMRDYRRRVEGEISKAFIDLRTLRMKAKSASMRVKASEEYAKLVEGRFENGLAGADELSRALADLAEAKALERSTIVSIEIRKASIWLMSGTVSSGEKIGSIALPSRRVTKR